MKLLLFECIIYYMYITSIILQHAPVAGTVQTVARFAVIENVLRLRQHVTGSKAHVLHVSQDGEEQIAQWVSNIRKQ